MENGIIHDKSNGCKIIFKPIPPFMAAILDEGGLIPYIQKHGDFKL
jgi:3-isopropylmalate/(R)-2-methylmalate dehydratase small subunit